MTARSDHSFDLELSGGIVAIISFHLILNTFRFENNVRSRFIYECNLQLFLSKQIHGSKHFPYISIY